MPAALTCDETARRSPRWAAPLSDRVPQGYYTPAIPCDSVVGEKGPRHWHPTFDPRVADVTLAVVIARGNTFLPEKLLIRPLVEKGQ